jgi:hypothetical protein
MLPLRDNVKSSSIPFINYIIIGINAIVFIYEVTLGPQLQEFFYTFGVIPDRFIYLVNTGENYFALIFPFFSSMFMHGDWFHIIFNMLFLYIFGDNVEDAMGHFRYVIFYLLCGIGASLLHIATNMGSTLPTIGASGAIAGVMGGYLILYPRAKVLTLVFLGIFIRIVEIPAIFFLILWFLIQFISGCATITSAQATGGVAFWAHIGGFICGLGLIFLFRKRDRVKTSEGGNFIKKLFER